LTGQQVQLGGWGMMAHSRAEVLQPDSVSAAQLAVSDAGRRRRTAIPRGSGFSYGDAALNGNSLVLDTRRLSRIIGLDGQGLVEVEAGVTIGDLCRFATRRGWWPPVVPGTGRPTLGGCVGANVHGKNAYIVGTFGEHVQELDLVLPDGSLLTCSEEREPDVFRAVIGGYGLLGVIVRMRMRLERQPSRLMVEEIAAPHLTSIMHILSGSLGPSDHAVAWIDACAQGEGRGRGIVQLARNLNGDSGGSDREVGRSGRRPFTRLRSALWPLLLILRTNQGVGALNSARYELAALNSGRTSIGPRERYQFFHDFIPDWRRAFRPGGVLQYQMFVPKECANEVFLACLEAAQEIKQAPILAVLKRHRTDPALLSYGVDGYSLSLDFPVTSTGLPSLRDALHRLTDEVVLPAGGRFYLAKDSILTPDQAGRSLGLDALGQFLAIKRRIDPGTLFQSDLYRRLFAPLALG